MQLQLVIRQRDGEEFDLKRGNAALSSQLQADFQQASQSVNVA